jgi:hypothetical protein
MTRDPDLLAKVVRQVFESPNVSDSNGEQANLVDTTAAIGTALYAVADAILDLAKAVRERPL